MTDGEGAQAPRGNPYVGPRAFTRGETIYGRDRELQRLVHLLIAERIVAVHSPSGAGKTSLIQAGLVPQLEREDFAVLPVVRVSLEPPPVGTDGAASEVTPNRYVQSVILSLEEGQSPEQRVPLSELTSLDLPTYLARRCASAGGGAATEWVLVFDQFEEVLTIDPTDEDAKTVFFNQLGAALRDRRFWALFALREDYLAGLDPYLRPIPTRLHTTFRLDLLGPEAARLAIQQPARAAGIVFEDAAAERLVDDMRRVRVQQLDGSFVDQLGAFVEPVQLQVVCRRMWDRLPPGTTRIVEGDLEAVGDVDQALAGYYVDQVAGVALQTGVPERAIREWVDRQLITEQDIRGQVLQGQDQSEGLPNAAILALVDTHLVRAERRRGFTWFELAHDRLIGPVRTDNAAWFEQHLSELQRQAALWERHDRQSGLVLRGKAYREAVAWASAHEGALTPVEREFLSAARELDEAAARDRRRVQWIQRLAVGAALLAILTTGASVWALWASQQATTAEAKATDALAQTNDALQKEQVAEQQATAAQSVAEEQAAVATQRGLIAQARDYFAGQLDLGLLLSLAAIHLNDTTVLNDTTGVRRALLDDARGALLDGLYFEPRLTTFLSPDVGKLGRVLGLKFADKQTLLSVSADDALRVWDVASATQRGDAVTLGGVRAVAFSPDAKLFATATSDNHLRLWDVQKLSMVADWDPQQSVSALGFSNDGKMLASGGCVTSAAGCGRGLIRTWTVADHHQQGSQIPVPREVTSLAFSPDGKLLAAGTQDGRVHRWTLPDRKEQGDAIVPSGLVIKTLAFSRGSRYLAVGTDSPRVYSYDLMDPSQPVQHELKGHGLGVNAVAFDPSAPSSNGPRLASASGDGTIMLWDLGTLQQSDPPPLQGHTADVSSLTFTADGSMLASAGSDGTIRLWQTIRDQSQFLRGPAPLGTRLANPTVDPNARSAQGVHSVVFSPDGQKLAGVFQSNSIALWNLASPDRSVDGQLFPGTLTQGQGKVQALAFTGDSSLLATSGCATNASPCPTGFVRFWNAASHEPDGPPITAEGSAIVSLAFHPDAGSRLFATGGEDGKIRFWDSSSRTELLPAQELQAANEPILSLTFSPTDGAMLASADANGRVVLWNAATRQELGVLADNAPGVDNLAFSPDGTLLAAPCGAESQCVAGSIYVWDVATRRARGEYQTGQERVVNGVVFIQDDTLATVGADGTLRLWDPLKHQPVGQPRLAYPFAVDGVAFNSTTGLLATSSTHASYGGSGVLEKVVTLWNLQPSSWADKACRIANRNLSMDEWTSFVGANIPYVRLCSNVPPGQGVPR